MNPRQKTVSSIVKRLVKGYRPTRIILFGSSLTEAPRAGSDLDILIIKDTDEKLVDRLAEVRRILTDPLRTIPLDILVLTPAEVKQSLKSKDQFISEIMKRGKVLYAA